MSQRNPRLIGSVYRTNQVVTSGGILTHYTADNHNTNEVVGLIVLELPSTADAQKVHQFFQPMERRRLVQSSQVIRVFDWGVDGKRAYIATDPPRGLTLRYVMDNEHIDLRRAFDFSHQMTSGVIALHAQDIVGVDLRPQLITVDSMETADRVQLDDVGLRSLLKVLGYVDSQREDDIGYLDPRYAPPEYIQGGLVGPWSDIYQLGLLLFEMVTGRPPFVGRDSTETSILQCTSSVPLVTQYRHDVPEALQVVLDQTLAKDPNERFIHAGALLNALESLQPTAHLAKDSDVFGKTQVPGGPAHSSADVSGYTIEKVLYAHLCYEQGGVETQRFAITKPVVIVGRMDPRRGLHPDVDLTALDPKKTVSRPHASITYKGNAFYLEDLKSHNKTHIGDVMLVPHKPELLQNGDTVYFGAVRLVFRMAQSE